MRSSLSLIRIAPLLVVTPLVSGVAAESISQETPYAASNQGSLYQGSGASQLVGADYFSASLAPFDTNLGTLLTFTIGCEISGELMGVVGAAEGSGTVN